MAVAGERPITGNSHFFQMVVWFPDGEWMPYDSDCRLAPLQKEKHLNFFAENKNFQCCCCWDHSSQGNTLNGFIVAQKDNWSFVETQEHGFESHQKAMSKSSLEIRL